MTTRFLFATAALLLALFIIASVNASPAAPALVTSAFTLITIAFVRAAVRRPIR